MQNAWICGGIPADEREGNLRMRSVSDLQGRRMVNGGPVMKIPTSGT